MNVDGTNQSLIAGNEVRDYSPSWSNNIANQSPISNSGGPYSGVIAQNISFSAIGSFDPDGTISSYSWTFGDGGTGSGVTPTHAYASTGTYNVSLTVTDNLGAQASSTTSATVTTAGSEQYLASFNLAALARQPYANESTYWNDILRSAYPNGQSSMLLAVRELGKTLFESSDYAARGRNNHWYVYDLYKSYLMREPDAPGWAYWENELTLNHINREQLRGAFDECGEFAGIVATLTPSGSPSSNVSSLSSARVDPFNQPGNGLAARDAEWSLPLLSLPGRAGLDLGLSLSYSSMVWTHSGPYIYFDEDSGWPSPGFRLGFPTVQQKSFDAQAGHNVFLMLSGGSRVSLRQVGTSNVYEAADSSYVQLIDNGGSLLLRTTDGTQLNYLLFNNAWHCTQTKDRNGNYITVNYDWLGHISTVIDTLGRTVTFNYDSNANLTSITQTWTVNGSPQTHTWASFGWTNKTLAPSFSGAMVVGANPSTIPVLSQVGLDDGTRYTFEYNWAGQLNPLRSFRSDNIQRAYTSFDYDLPADDCPRVIDTHVWAENWTGVNGVAQEVATNYAVPGDGSHTMTTLDGTVYKEFYGTGWQRGLVSQTEIWGRDNPNDHASPFLKQKWTVSTWSQDNTSVSYQTNPRVTETNVFDSATPQNHRRATVSYAPFLLPSGASCPLPTDVREYAADATTVLRHSHTDYRMDPAADSDYFDRHILGLAKEQTLYEVDPNTGAETLRSKVGYQYDETSSIQGNDAPVRHDNDNYGANFVTGRANLSSVKRYDVMNSGQWTVNTLQYNTAGSAVKSTDPLGHQNSISYSDSFSDGNNSRNTFAYPKTITDADGYSSTLIYNFDFGAITSKQTPLPNTTANLPGPIQTFAYDSAKRIERVTSMTNGAYSRYVYGPNYVQQFSTINTIADEAYSIQTFDGLGRTIGAASNHPGSTGGYSAVNTIYDSMGRVFKQSNPTEITSSWLPAGDDLAGWFYAQQTYDWKGRPLITTNTDGSTKEASYAGCGCAGGEVTTLTDEGTLDGGVAKRRQQKIYADVLGRTVKTELFNWQEVNVYSTTVNSYNSRDQVKLVRQYSGSEESGIYQDTTVNYDGYGRLKTKHLPEQQVDPNNSASTDHTTWAYNDDDTVHKITDARGASATYGYNNNRRLTNTITYYAPTGVAATADVSFAYDAVGNRTSMTDGSGTVTYSFDPLSRLTSESRTFTGLTGSFAIGYGYNLANQLISLSEPTQFGSTFSYGYDLAGQLTSVNGSSYGGVTTYASNTEYRASGALKHLEYGNGKTLDATYNSRLQAASFIIPGVMSKTYDYYADGSLRFSSDLLNHKMDRFNGYDQAGRIKEAFSGAEARFEPQTNDRPYRETFGYDGSGHLTTRTSNIWRDSFSTADTYVNNRHPDWSYDADGNLLSGADDSYTYDAAGRIKTVASFDPVSSTTRGLDGAGQQVRTDETTYNEETQTSTTTTKYYLRSSVLDNQVLTEIDADGSKLRTFVYAGGSVLAWQVWPGPYARVVWEHRDPSDASFRTTDVTGSPWGHGDDDQPAELDPMGGNAGLHAPLVEPGPSPDEGNDSLVPYPSFHDPRRPGTIYLVDYVQVTVDYFFQELERGSHGSSLQLAEAAGRGTIYTQRWVHPKWRPQAPTPSNPFDPFVPDQITTKTVEVAPGHWESTSMPLTPSLMSVLSLTPQNPSERRLTRDEYLALRGTMAEALKSEHCRNFIDTLVTAIQKGGERYDSGEDFLAYSDYIYNSPDGGVFFRAGEHGGQTGNKFRLGEGIRPDLNVPGNAGTLMHLLIHGLTSRYASDDTLDKKIRDLGITPIGLDGKPLPFPSSVRYGTDWSAYWDRALKNACFPKSLV